jgi:hypothetical protein
MKTEGYIFVLMPFDKAFDDIYTYGIKQTANNCEFYCERVDEQIFQGSILSRIYNQIEKADLIIADLSNKNPNVFYETGYAHALNKNVILLTQNSDDIPFDLKHYPHIIYNGNIKFLSEELTKKINWYKNNENKRNDNSGFIEFFNKGKKIDQNSTIIFDEIKFDHPFEKDRKKLDDLNLIRFTLNIYNNGNALVDTIADIGIVIENIFYDSKFANERMADIVHLPDNKILLTFGGGEFMYPQTWKTYTIDLGYKKQFKKFVETAELRIFRENGYLSIPVKVEYKTIEQDHEIENELEWKDEE